MHLVLGVDAGGTSSRAALFTLDGTLVRRGQAEGANPGALGMDTAAANLTAAVHATLADPGSAHLPGPVTGAGTVVGVVVGLAGNPALCATLTERVFGALLPGADLSGEPGVPGVTPVRVTGDIVTAFAAGTPSPSGTVLISGTGAIAARIADHAPAGTADGYGWLLGDEGSAFWIGLAAARATIRAITTPCPSPTRTGVDLVRDHEPNGTAHRPEPGRDEMSAGHEPGAREADGRRPARGGAGDREASGGGRAGWGLLAEIVLGRLLPDGPGGDPGARLAAAVHARPPLALAELAPLVSEAAMGGDPVALTIVAEAASKLASTASRVHEPGLPLVLAGGVLTAEGPVRDAVRGLLEGAVTAGDPAGAAAWLAARPLLGPREAEARHSRFTHPA
ncbi:BadF/BadG/BcrA/BcrD ATPase family protein [Nonomuraea sp. B1E8]|uniref:N-acetylglucosamine kinase n=1 Tax=unclassified Nonomuraea TaxID=2593643 RepID=UPI00325F8400